MATPTLQQARRQYQGQQAILAGALLAVRKLFSRNSKPSIPEIAATAARYQAAAATLSTREVAGYVGDQPQTSAQAFLGVSSFGFSLTEPIIATIDQQVPAPVEAMPAPWWDDAAAFMANVERLLLSEIADAGRSASQVEFVSRPEWTNYVRMLTPPSCGRCTILAGRIYRDVEAFARHPQCDCVMVPVTDWQDAHDKGLVSSPQQAVDAGQVTGLSEADTKAIEDGADLTAVINATRGIARPTVFGRRVNTTTVGTTARSQWRRANPSRLVRLRPESIYQIATDRADAIRLLGVYGYL